MSALERIAHFRNRAMRLNQELARDLAKKDRGIRGSPKTVE
jgi:hypothetical protein